MDTVHMKLVASLTGQPLFSELLAEHQKNPPRDLAEVRDPLRGRPVRAGTHRILVEALGGHADAPLPSGIHGRLSTALVG